MKKLTAKEMVRYGLLFLLSAGMLFLAFRKVEWGEFWEIMTHCNWWWILATMLIQCVITLLRALRWRGMLRPVSRGVSLGESYHAYSLCYLANLVFPRSGEVARCALLAETRKTTFEGSLGTVVIERTWDMLCVFLAAVPLLFFGTFRNFLAEKMVLPAVESLRGGGVWVPLLAVALLLIAIVCVRRLKAPLSRSRAGASALGFLRGLGDGIRAGFRMEKKWAFFGYTVLIWIGYWLCSLWTLYAFPHTGGMNGWDALFVMVVGSLGWIVPVQGGFGAYHVIVAVTLVPIYGFAYPTALAFATVSHESQFVQMLVQGLVSLAIWIPYRRRFKTVQETVNKQDTAI